LASLGILHYHGFANEQLLLQPFYGSLDFVCDNLGEMVPEETFTHLHYCGHNHPLSASSIFYDPRHPPCSIYMPDNHFPQSLSKFSLV